METRHKIRQKRPVINVCSCNLDSQSHSATVTMPRLPVVVVCEQQVVGEHTDCKQVLTGAKSRTVHQTDPIGIITRNHVINTSHQSSSRRRVSCNSSNRSEPLSSRAIRFAPRNSLMLHLLIGITIIILYLIQQQPIGFGSSAFNLDTNSAIVHSGPDDSFFGYSVAVHKDRNDNWLLVGAPKASTNQPNTEQAGAVYKCPTKANRACQPIDFDRNGSSVITLANNTKVTADSKSHQFFGASLHSAGDSGTIIACAPNYNYYSVNFKRRDPVGTCWISRGSLAAANEPSKRDPPDYSPCRLNDQWGHHHLGSCQAGFSSAISKDGSRIFMGAPGAHVWQGQAFGQNLKTDLVNTTSPLNPHSEDDSYLGYSLALGRFSSSAYSEPNTKDGAVIDVAIGIPRADDLVGKVMIVDREMRFIRNITGEQLGAYFGYSIAVADVNGDGLDDLLIGAPLYYNRTLSNKEPHFDRGRVYVMLQNSRHEFNLAQRLDGHKNRARFGTAIANCGDLNRDGLQDIAVGAPYDGPNGHGAVYIYMGRKHGLGNQGNSATEYDQVIYAESIRNEQLRSFGFSLSSGLDLDANQYPDLLVGDYKADRVILLRTRPVVNITTSLTFQPDHFNLDDKTCLLPNSSTSVPCVTVKYCLKYSGMNVEKQLPFVFDIKLDTESKGAPRLFFLDNPGKNEDRSSATLSKDVNHCRTKKAYIMRDIRDKLTPLKVDVDYNLADYAQIDTYDSATGQTKLKPVLNKIGTPTTSGESAVKAAKLTKVATIQKNCGADNVCIPDLKLLMNSNLDQYTIGSDEKLILDVTVKNYGDDAYESMFYLTMPMTINYIAVNKSRNDYPICHGPRPEQTGVNVLTCDLGNPQPKNDAVKFSVITEPVQVSQFTSPDFTFTATVNSTNPEQDDRHRDDNQVSISIPIRVEVDLVLSGSSNPPVVIYNANRTQVTSQVRVTEADLGPEVYHIYQLQNKGPSTIHDIAVTILWPTKMKDKDNFLLYPVDEPITTGRVRCRPAPENTVNPLGLKYMKGNSINIIYSQDQQQQQQQQPQQQQQQQPQQVSRQRRQSDAVREPILSSAYYTSPTLTSVDDSILQPMNPSQWTRFDCNVFDLAHDEIATIKIRSRLYEDTIAKLGLQEFDISSKLVAQIKALPYNVSAQHMDPYNYKVETQVHTSGSSIQELIPWWVIVLAILLGIALFVCLACFLKSLGFFTRKRPPKGPEREPLTPTPWNDYNYSPGDTAL